MATPSDPRNPPRGLETLLFMNISAVQGQPEKSVEEIRIEDYLKAYSATGRPPAPYPTEPQGDVARQALGLPPLFKPLPVVANEPTAPLPLIHTFEATPVDEPTTRTKSYMQNITAQPAYSGRSFEELRFEAHLSGNVKVPVTFATPAPISTPKAQSTSPYFADDSPAKAYNTQPGTPGAEYFMSMSAGIKHMKHSFEELRISHLRAGRELPSTEISPQANATPAISFSNVNPFAPLGPSTGGAFARSPAVRPF